MAKPITSHPHHKPQNGHIYLCVRSSRMLEAVKGKHYVYNYGELKVYSTRHVDCFSNGDQMLRSAPQSFQLARKCPFCGCQTLDPITGERWIHDGAECARKWDAHVKNYCLYCSGDTKNGKCPKCDVAG